MAKVKGATLVNYKVVPHEPIRRLLFSFIGILIFAASVVGAFYVGEALGIRKEESLLAERADLKEKLLQSMAKEAELRQKVAVLENASFVDKGSIDDVRRSNRELSDQIASLEKEIALYQGIMSPSVNTAGLTIEEVTLNSTPSSNRYRFKVMLTQVGSNSKYLSGFVGINLLGVQKGEITAYPLKDLSAEIKDIDIKFKYRYFQEFKGELVLPEDFTPDQIQVIAQSVGAKSARIEKSYNWSDLENGNNVGQ